MEDPVSSKLRDGATVLLRRLGPSDIDAVKELHNRLTKEELYLRFFTPHPGFLPELADQLTDSGGQNYALGAFEADELVGVANYAMCGKPATADVAAVVAHGDHSRGVGTALLRRLVHVARVNGVRHLVGDVLSANSAMFDLLHEAGLKPQRKAYDCGVVHLDVDLSGAEFDSV
ncbi:GNAT family N-acetyltransferase [Mycobacterium paraterrae]|uniref:GNAT family N-acetyltransferase n=1 Tax=Mycobacterium paraterrae TaxID=577492 RepID=A0ABY3VNW7_9MYCO|nr:GNAT family N-acetyltransferase [Mycobacterium paraterrae]UMB70882.1 GNAT family N-acetyltransferase [Mycobacterium paraterrae]